MLRLQEMFRGALMATTLVTMAAWAQTPAKPPSARASKTAKPVKHMMSPYARAAGQRERAGQAPAGHPGQTMVQAVGKPHKPHAPGKPQ